MRALTALVVFMGVLLVVGVAVIVATLVHRMGAPAVAMPDVVLNEPAGTHVAGVGQVGDRLAVLLQGGGPDRITLIDPHGHVAGHVRLAAP
jgi:hypothetical protein